MKRIEKVSNKFSVHNVVGLSVQGFQVAIFAMMWMHLVNLKEHRKRVFLF